MRKIFFICLIFNQLNLFSQSIIKSATIFNPKTNDETAVIKTGEYLLFSFDELNKNFKNYNFTVYHCDRNWNRSDLFQSQYLDGYFNDEITSRKASFKTLQPYTHYEFKFPSQNIRPKYSGNYELIVYENSDENPLLKFRFSIYEDLSNLNIIPERNLNSNSNLTQRVKINANTIGFNANQIVNSLELKVIQNNNWNKKIEKIKPQFINGNVITFNALDILFEGSNEFHFFDTKDLKVNGASTQSIKQNEFYEHTLYFNTPFEDDYLYNPDVNGAYYFRKFDFGIERNSSIEGDYLWVLFGLKTQKLENKEVYVVGAFNNYQITNENKMIYKEGGFYELPLFLKQGYYNYQFVTKDSKNKIDYSEIDKSFWQTENLYQGFLYINPWGFNYDALVGYGEYRLPR